jgi:lauroyl/myristoyl acyltransferase
MSEPARPARLPGLVRQALRLAATAPLPAGYWLAAALGELAFRLDRDRAQQTIAAVAVVLAQPAAHPAARRLARAGFRAEAMMVLDGWRLPALPPAMVERGLLGQGWEHLDAALARGQGAVVVTATVGAWNLVAPVLVRRGYRVADAADTTEATALAALARNEVVVLVVEGSPVAGLTEVGTLGHTPMVPGPSPLITGLTPLPPLVRGESGSGALTGQPPLAPLIWGEPADAPQRDSPLIRGARGVNSRHTPLSPPLLASVGSVPVRVFGRPTTLPVEPARLALRGGAPLLHGWLLRRLDLISFQGGVEPVPAPPLTGDPAVDEAVLTQALADRLQCLVQAHPEQWTGARPWWPTPVRVPADSGSG